MEKYYKVLKLQKTVKVNKLNLLRVVMIRICVLGLAKINLLTAIHQPVT